MASNRDQLEFYFFSKMCALLVFCAEYVGCVCCVMGVRDARWVRNWICDDK